MPSQYLQISASMQITNTEKAANYLRSKMKDSDVEEFWAIALDFRCGVLGAKMLFRGTVDMCLIHPRDIFRFALTTNASSLIIGHNHPSRDCKPSSPDIDVTRKLKRAGELLQIPIVDHLIVTRDGFFSFARSRFWENDPIIVRQSLHEP